MGARTISHDGCCGRSVGSIIVIVAACLCCVTEGRIDQAKFKRFEISWLIKLGLESHKKPRSTSSMPPQVTTAFANRIYTYNSTEIMLFGPQCIADSSSELFDITCVWTGKRPLTIIDMRLIWTHADGRVADFEKWLGLCGAQNETVIGDQMWAVVHSCSTHLNMDSIPVTAKFQARASWSRTAPSLFTSYVSCMVRGDNGTHILATVSRPIPVVFCGPRKAGVNPWPVNTFPAGPVSRMAWRTTSRIGSEKARIQTHDETTAGVSEENTMEGWTLREILAPLSGVLVVAVLLITVGICMSRDDEKFRQEDRFHESVPAEGPISIAEQLRRQSTLYFASLPSVAHSTEAYTKKSASAVSFDQPLEGVQSGVRSVAKTVASSSPEPVRSASAASMQPRHDW